MRPLTSPVPVTFSVASRPKPLAVTKAEVSLWTWLAFTCVVGVYQSVLQIPEIEAAIADQLQGLISVEARTLLEVILGSYAVIALTSAWVIFQLGRRKNWARVSLVVGIVLDAGYTALVPGEGWLAWVDNVPDFVLQAYALYMLYTGPGAAWFADSVPSRKR